jgi:hypothetical protein
MNQLAIITTTLVVCSKIDCVLNEYYTKPETWKATGVQVEFLSYEDPFAPPSVA